MGGDYQRVHEIRDSFDKDPQFQIPRDEPIPNVASALKDYLTEVCDDNGKKSGLLGGTMVQNPPDPRWQGEAYLQSYHQLGKKGVAETLSEYETVERVARILVDYLSPVAVHTMWAVLALIRESAKPEHAKYNLLDLKKSMQYGAFTHDLYLVMPCAMYEQKIKAKYVELLEESITEAEEDPTSPKAVKLLRWEKGMDKDTLRSSTQRLLTKEDFDWGRDDKKGADPAGGRAVTAPF